MNKILKIVKHEFKMTAANKAFIIITILGPFLLFGVSVLPTLMAQNTKIEAGTTIGIIGGAELVPLVSQPAKNANITLVEGDSTAEMSDMVMNGELNGYIVIPSDYLNARSFDYFSKSGTDIYVSETLGAIIGNIVVGMKMQKAGLDPQLVSSLSARPSMQLKKIVKGDQEETENGGSDFMTVMLTSIAFMLLLYMTVLLYGQMIGRSVVNEKVSKTVELMLSSSRPLEMMYGKIIGIGLAGLIQYIFWIAMAVGLIGILGPIFHISLATAINSKNLIFLVLFFITAYFLYASIYSALGAGAEDEQHLGQLSYLPIIFLIVPMVTVSSIVMNPSSGLALFLSYFPFTSPLVMFIRVLIDMPPISELVICFAILIITILFVVYAASRIFRIGILMTGKRFKLKEILRWVKA